jgi:hypothetical protein
VVGLAAFALALVSGQPATDPAVRDVVERTIAYVEAYQRQFAAVTATEHYVQEERRPRSRFRPRTLPIPRRNLEQIQPIERVVRSRTLQSHILLVPTGNPAPEIWAGFRDVFEVDGKPVREREERLKSLFLSGEGRLDLRRIADESARYNIGAISRNFNVPLLGLGFAHPAMHERFRFRKVSEERREGRVIWILRLDERREETVVRTPEGDDAPARARLWVDPASGAVAETEVIVETPHGTRATITITFESDRKLEMLVPVKMEEVYEWPDHRQRGYTWALATYTDVQRFSVRTHETFRE